MKSGCTVCKNDNYMIIGSAKPNNISGKFINKDYKVVQCCNCKLYYVSPEISFNDDEWTKLYNSEYFRDQSNWLLNKRAEELSSRFDKAESLLDTNTKIKFLDIGTGEGKALFEGYNRGWDVTGIDIVDNRIEIVKNIGHKFIIAKFLEQEFPIDHFDFIYLDSVLEHVMQPKEYLLKIKRILKKDGILYIGIPNEDCLYNDIRRVAFTLTGNKNISSKIKPFDAPYHVIGFNKQSLNFILNETGLELKFLRNFGRKYQFLSSSPKNKAFWILLFFLLPIEFLGYLIGRDVYFEAYLTK